MTAVSSPPSPPTSRTRMNVAAKSHVGMQREHNEDDFVVTDITSGTRGAPDRPFLVGPHGVLFAVCDGMGGAAAGEVASRMALDVVSADLVRSRGASKATSHTSLARRLRAAIHRASEQINDEALKQPKMSGMGTTITAAAVVGEYLIVAQVGDSRAYLLRDGYLSQISRDQSLFEKLLEASALSKDEAETFEHANVILQALGALRDVEVEIVLLKLSDGDRVLLCSDGLSGLLPDDVIGMELAEGPTPESICDRLITAANDAGGYDNVTVVVAFLSGPSLITDEPAPLILLDDAGNPARMGPLPDPRNLLAAYAPRHSKSLRTAAAPAPAAVSARPDPIFTTGPQRAIPGGGTENLDDKDAPAAVFASVGPAPPAQRTFRIVVGAALLSVAVAAGAAWMIVRTKPAPTATTSVDGGDGRGWTTFEPTAAPSATPLVRGDAPSLAPIASSGPRTATAAPTAAAGEPAPTPRGPTGRPTPAPPASHAPAASHPPATGNPPKYEPPIPIEDYP